MITAKRVIKICESTELIDNRKDKSGSIIYAGFDKNLLVIGTPWVPSEWSSPVDRLNPVIIVDLEKKVYRFPNFSSLDDRTKKYMTNIPFVTTDQHGAEKILDELRRFNIISGNFKFQGQKPSFNFDTRTGRDVMYHGTSSSNLDRIMKVGLMPSVDGFGSYFRGNASTIKSWTQNFVYLTPSLPYAKSYALRQSGGSVVLRVEIPDPNKLFIDDEYLREKLRSKFEQSLNSKLSIVDSKLNLSVGPWSKVPMQYSHMYSFANWDRSDNGVSLLNYLLDVILGKSLLDIKDALAKESYEYNKKFASDRGWDYMTWTEYCNFIHWCESCLRTIYSQIINTNWKSSAYSDHQAVGYKGRIPPNFISVAWQSNK